MLPHDFPHWRTVYGYFQQWQQDGTWARIESVQRRIRCEARRLETMPNGRRGHVQTQPTSPK
jgi:transposase